MSSKKGKYYDIDLIYEILLRLPAKTLGQCKCVSKGWRGLISHPRFVLDHATESLRRRTLLLADDETKLYSGGLENVSYEDTVINLRHLNFTGNANEALDLEGPKCVGSANGLLCMTNRRGRWFVWNPFTGECRKVLHTVSNTARGVYGFGYAPSIDEYKFLMFYRLDRNPSNMAGLHSVRTNSYKQIPNPLAFPADYSRAGVCLNGALHWAYEKSGLCEIAIFDLVDDMFKTLAPPASVLRGNCQYSLGIVNGCLCLATESEDDRETQFWMMEKYGIESSWNRIGLSRQFCKLRPVGCLTHNQLVILMTEQGFILWDRRNELKNLVLRVVDDQDLETQPLVFRDFRRSEENLKWSEENMYVQSLVQLSNTSGLTIKDNPYMSHLSKGATEGQ